MDELCNSWHWNTNTISWRICCFTAKVGAFIPALEIEALAAANAVNPLTPNDL
jgi:hypothetical protein